MRGHALSFLSAALALALPACQPDRALGPEAGAPLLQIMGDLPTNSLLQEIIGLRFETRGDRTALLIDLRVSASLIEARKGSFRLRASARMTEDGDEVGFLEQDNDVQTIVSPRDPSVGTLRLAIPAHLLAQIRAMTGKTDPLDLLVIEASLTARPPGGLAFEVAQAVSVTQNTTSFTTLEALALNAAGVTLTSRR
jgi:hypothetical protein